MSRSLPFIAILLGVVPGAAFAQNKPVAPPATDDRPIVITGERLSDLQRDLKACLDRKCPPDQDIAATLKVAENQFVNGDYRDARSTLTKSIGRNKRYAKEYPEPVSDLLRANYRIAAHLGDGESYRVGTFDTVSALKAGMPDTDPRVLGAQIEVGDMFARFNRLDDAIDQYGKVEKRAEALKLYNIQGMALLRVVGLYTQLALALPTQYRPYALRSAAVLTSSTDPHLQPFAQAAQVLIARMNAKSGDPAAVDKLIADFRTMARGTVPILLFAPPIETDNFNDRQASSGENLNKLARRNYDGEWVDIGFWITPDGRVNDVDVLRSGRGVDQPDWTKPILKAIGGRRYAPLKMDPSQPGILRVERYTMVARETTQTGSRLTVREPTTQIEMLDLSEDPIPVPTGK